MNLRQIREAAGVTRIELCSRLRIDPVQLWRWETGKVKPTVDSLRRIAAALDVDIAELVR